MRNIGGVATLTAILGVSAPAKAIIFSEYTNRTAWENAVTAEGLSFTEEDFNSFTQDESFAGSSFNVGDFTLSASRASSAYDNQIDDLDSSNVSSPPNRNIDGTNYIFGAKGSSNTFSVTFDSPIKAFGWEYNSLSGEGWDIEGNAISLPNESNGGGAGSFFGVVNTDADSFTTINLTGSDTAFGLDNFVYSSDVASASVPFEFSPALGLLTVGGFFGVKYLRRKKAAKIEDM